MTRLKTILGRWKPLAAQGPTYTQLFSIGDIHGHA